MQCEQWREQWSGLEKMKKNRRKKRTCGLAVLPVAVDGVAVADCGANWLVVLLSFSAFPFCFFSLLLCSSSCSLFYSFSPSLVLSNVPWSCCLQMKMKLRVISALIEQRFFLFFCYYFRFWFSFHLILICTLLLLRLWFLKWRRQWQRWFWSQRFPLHTFFPSTRFCLPLVLLPTFSLVLLAPPPCLLLFFFLGPSLLWLFISKGCMLFGIYCRKVVTAEVHHGGEGYQPWDVLPWLKQLHR